MNRIWDFSLLSLTLLIVGCNLSPPETDYNSALEAFRACKNSARVKMRDPVSKELLKGTTLLQVACIREKTKDSRVSKYWGIATYSETDDIGEEKLSGFSLPPYGFTFPSVPGE